MTGYNSSFFRHDCGEAERCYIRHLPNWDDLIEAFPRGIRPTDVDGLVEVGGQLLFMEEKSAGAHLPEGQRRAFLNLARRPGITVLCMRPLATATDMECLVLGQGDALGWQPKSRDGLRDWLSAWAEAADSQPRIGGEAA